MASSKQLEARPKVDPRDEPSAEWGWHGSFPKTVRVMGWFLAFALLILLIGNHTGNTENVWLIGMSLTIIGVLLFDMRKRRTSWRR